MGPHVGIFSHDYDFVVMKLVAKLNILLPSYLPGYEAWDRDRFGIRFRNE